MAMGALLGKDNDKIPTPPSPLHTVGGRETETETQRGEGRERPIEAEGLLESKVGCRFMGSHRVDRTEAT